MLEKYTIELAKIGAQIKDLETLKESLRKNILDEMKTSNLKSYKSDVGTVSFITKVTYKYSESVDALKAKVATRQKYEESHGLATEVINEHIQFSLPKIKDDEISR